VGVWAEEGVLGEADAVLVEVEVVAVEEGGVFGEQVEGTIDEKDGEGESDDGEKIVEAAGLRGVGGEGIGRSQARLRACSIS